MTWLCKKFDDLTPRELYFILQLRIEVFVVEQRCAFQDADNRDPYCHHVYCLENEKPIAYARIIPPGISYVESSIGRVVTSPAERNKGIGIILMQKSIEALYKLYGNIPVKIGAQLYLKKFYESFGFKQASEIYIEDDIPHIHMML